MAKSKSTTRSRGLSPIVLDRMLCDLHHRLALVASDGKDMANVAAMIHSGGPLLTLVQIVARHQAADAASLADLVGMIIERTQTPAIIKARAG